MDCALDAAPLTCSRLGCRIICTLKFYNITRFVLDNLLTLNDIGVLESDLSLWLETEELLRSIFHKVSSLDKKLTCKWNLSACSFWLCWVERTIKPLYLTLWPVGDSELDRILNYHIATGSCVEILSHTPLKKLDIHELISL